MATDISFKRSLSELSVILNHVDSEIVSKIPKSFINFMNKEKSTQYVFKYDASKALEEQNVSRETLVLLSAIYTKWCVSDETRNEIVRSWKENDIKQENINYDYIFKKPQQDAVEKDLQADENKLIIIKNENIFVRILNKMKNIFIKK